MSFIEELKDKARTNRKTIVLPEGMDRRTYEAAEQIIQEDFADIILLASEEELEEYGKDYHDFKTLNVELYSPKIEEQFKKLLSSPSNRCINCNDFSVCAGGCLLQWLSYNFSDLMKDKEDYYARKTN